MNSYKHTQIGYPALAVLIFFAWLYITSSAGTPSIDLGQKIAVSAVVVSFFSILSSFVTLTVSIDESYIRIKFGYGLIKKKISLQEIASVKSVKNSWYCGILSWGTSRYLGPKIWVYNVSGFDLVQLTLKNGEIHRIGTNETAKLEAAILTVINI